MAKKVNPAIAAVLAAVFAAQASAQDSSHLSRAQVKGETRAAAKAGKLVPAGEGPRAEVPTSSQTTRERRRAETLAARRAGLLINNDLARSQRVDNAYRTQPATVDRVALKAET